MSGRFLLLLATSSSLLLSSVASFHQATVIPQYSSTLCSANPANARCSHQQSSHGAFRISNSPSWQDRQVSASVTALNAIPRGGAAVAGGVMEAARNWNKTPSSLFNTCLLSLGLVTFSFRLVQRLSSKDSNEVKKVKPKSVRDRQIRFLSVFWLLRCADWLQGPYFYEVYASKIFNGVPASMSLISKLFLTGFASTAIFGPSVGSAQDRYGRKLGTLAFSVIYAIGAFSTKSTLLQVLVFGRIMSGIGTSLLFSAPESWLVGASQSSGDDPDGNYLGETFGLAYAGDSIVAILAGQLAGVAAGKRGPSGPFELSTIFLLMGGLLTAALWKENKAQPTTGEDGENTKLTISDAVKVVRDDPKIMLVGGVQSLFEAAMYIFVLQWPPVISRSVAKAFGEGVATPYGAVFSCFMASCLFGSTLFGYFTKKGVTTEKLTSGMLFVAALAMSMATFTSVSSMGLASLISSLFVFEACVGIYFPSIGSLRSKYLPDSHRSVIMNLFGIPLNVLVVSVFLSISKLGVNGALGISSGALAIAAGCMYRLNSLASKETPPAAAAN